MENPILDRRLRTPLLLLFVAYAIYLILIWAIRESGLPQGSPLERWLAAMLPLAPFMAMAAIFIRVYGRLDEVERVMHHTALAFGFVVMLLVALLAARLASLELVEEGARLVWPAGILGWMTGLVWGRWRFR